MLSWALWEWERNHSYRPSLPTTSYKRQSLDESIPAFISWEMTDAQVQTGSRNLLILGHCGGLSGLCDTLHSSTPRKSNAPSQAIWNLNFGCPATPLWWLFNFLWNLFFFSILLNQVKQLGLTSDAFRCLQRSSVEFSFHQASHLQFPKAVNHYNNDDGKPQNKEVIKASITVFSCCHPQSGLIYFIIVWFNLIVAWVSKC